MVLTCYRRKLEALLQKLKAKMGVITQFNEITYFDAPPMLIVDPMHNCSLEHFLKLLIDRGIISHTQFDLIQQRMDSFTVPSGKKVAIVGGSGSGYVSIFIFFI